MKTTIGGDRLGSGNKQTVDLKTYNRSTHDLSYLWRSTMASGTLVPFMSEVGLPGDTFDIELNCDVLTHPTVGPLFGSYKIQLDIFKCPVRLYEGKLHMNMLGIGMDMSKIKLPLLELEANGSEEIATDDNGQINPSSIFSYLNIRGLGVAKDGTSEVKRKFNAIPYLSYWDIYKNYYANKQEEIGVVIHNDLTGTEKKNIIDAVMVNTVTFERIDVFNKNNPQQFDDNWQLEMHVDVDKGQIPTLTGIDVVVNGMVSKNQFAFANTRWNDRDKKIICWIVDPLLPAPPTIRVNSQQVNVSGGLLGKPKLKTFPLTNIDEMRKEILSNVLSTAPKLINKDSLEPYNLPMLEIDATANLYSKRSSQEGLGIKTYQSDLFNNWISTEWIDGVDGISSITAVDTSSGEFTIDSLNLSRKVYDMLNRIAISGGSYDDWLDAVYTHERARSIESPVYMGGLIKELVFQEVISNASSLEGETQQPLGTLAGRGVLGKKHKGGRINVKVDEPSYIMGIISITPRIDYSQGNKWDTNLKTMDDFHKPALDEIGFQDLITDQMAWFDTEIDTTDPLQNTVHFKSAGKQPAWTNYMTNVNQVRGNFADQEQQMFMVLNRRYERGETGIEDLTTYIDPSKFNHIFADTSLDAQNFWTQISVDMKARRKMSSKIMPNL